MYKIVAVPKPKCDEKTWPEVRDFYTDVRCNVTSNPLSQVVSLCIPEAKNSNTLDIFKSEGPFQVQKSIRR